MSIVLNEEQTDALAVLQPFILEHGLDDKVVENIVSEVCTMAVEELVEDKDKVEI